MPLPDLILSQSPEMDTDTHGLFATIDGYMKVLRRLLNDGNGSNSRTLKASTTEWISKNGLPAGVSSGGWTKSISSLSNPGEFDPGSEKPCAHTFQRNEQGAVMDRPAGSLMWARLVNLFYWIDHKTPSTSSGGRRYSPSWMPFPVPGFIDFEAAF